MVTISGICIFNLNVSTFLRFHVFAVGSQNHHSSFRNPAVQFVLLFRTLPICKAQRKALWSPFSWPKETLLNHASPIYNPEFSPEQSSLLAKVTGLAVQAAPSGSSGAAHRAGPRRRPSAGPNRTPTSGPSSLLLLTTPGVHSPGLQRRPRTRLG